MKKQLILIITLILSIPQLFAQTITKEETDFFDALIEAKKNTIDYRLNINNYALAKCLNDETIAKNNQDIILALQKLKSNDELRNEFYGLVNYYFSGDKQLINDAFQVYKTVSGGRINVIDELSMDNTIFRIINAKTYEIKYASALAKIDSTIHTADTGLETNAHFPGGEKGLMDYIRQQVNYPTYEKSQNISGKLYIRFTVEGDGKVTNVTVIKNISPGIDHEGIRVIKMMPLWEPATKGNLPVRQWYNIPINFSI